MFQKDLWYTFNTKAPAVIGNFIEPMQVTGVGLSYELANMVTQTADLQVLNETLIPFITGLSDSIENMTFCVFKGKDGVPVVLAEEWIDITTVTAVTKMSLLITVFNAKSGDEEMVKNTLRGMGLTVSSRIITS